MSKRRKTRPTPPEDVPRNAAIPPLVGLAVGLGDPEREQALLSALDGYEDIRVVERCLSADQLLSAVQQRGVDAVLVAGSLHRLTEARLNALSHERVPTVLLAADGDDPRWRSFSGIVLPQEASADLVHDALLAAVRGERLPTELQTAEDVRDAAEREAEHERVIEALSVIAVAGGPGSGRTTVALNLAAALGAVAPTVLVDLDLCAPSTAVCLDADPTRNVAMLVHAEPETPRDWDRAIQGEVQPIHPRSPHAVVVCAVPKPEMRSTITRRFAEQLVMELRQRYRHVLVDLGADLLGPEGPVYGSVLAAADQILLASSADLVGLWRTRSALQLMHDHLQLERDRVALVLTRYDRRHHHGRGEIEWALDIPVAAVVPRDHRAIERALAAQQPVVLNSKSRAGSALLDLAARVNGGKILVPAEDAHPTRSKRWMGWRRWPKTIPAFGKR